MTRTLWAAFAALPLLPLPATALEKSEVLSNYANIAAAAYGDSLTTAASLKAAVAALVASPSQANLVAARTAYLAARVPYMQTEAFRFGNPIVDDWEGKVNAWPLDEGLIDYVDPGYGGATDENEYAALNVIATPKFDLAGQSIDASTITPAPSPRTKPSRSRSQGRDAALGSSLRVDSARMAAKPPTPKGDTVASVPPATMMSASPYSIMRPA